MEAHLSPGPAGHETRDAGIRPIAGAGAFLAVSIAIVGLLVYGAFQYLAMHPVNDGRANPMSASDVQPPAAPRIEEHPAMGLEQLRAQEDRTLSTYGWVNKQAGVVRIPVERAMELQLERGFPTRKEQVRK